MIKICVVTATRAEYGIFVPLLRRLMDCADAELRLVVTGTHLCSEYGMTVQEIEADGFPIDARIDILQKQGEDIDVSATMASALAKFAAYFSQNKPDTVLLLGDRYETLAVAIAAYNERIPIVHLYGGDTTEGALDEAYRHAITKMSYLHFVSNEQSGKRVIQLGENPNRVFVVGNLGIENALMASHMTREELGENLQFSLTDDYAVVTFHPVTLEGDSAKAQCLELMAAMDKRSDLRYLITKSNADESGMMINALWDTYGERRENVLVVTSLGMKRYLSAVSNAKMVIGNSSSGLCEVPAFHVPTVNIGDRQKGRLRGGTVIDCLPQKEDILTAMGQAEDPAFLEKIKTEICPYGDGNTSGKMLGILLETFQDKEITLKKNFFDL